jgi:hypothetical protein
MLKIFMSINILINGLRYKKQSSNYLVVTTLLLQRGSVLAHKKRISDETEILITLR